MAVLLKDRNFAKRDENLSIFVGGVFEHELGSQTYQGANVLVAVDFQTPEIARNHRGGANSQAELQLQPGQHYVQQISILNDSKIDLQWWLHWYKYLGQGLTRYA